MSIFSYLCQKSSKTFPKNRSFDLIKRTEKPLYDRITLIPGQKSHTFFEHPLGTIDPITGEIKTQVDTNLDQSQNICGPKNFEITALRLIPSYETKSENVTKIANYGWLQLCIGAKDSSTAKDVIVVNTFQLMRDAALRALLSPSKTPRIISVYSGRPHTDGIYTLGESVDLISGQRFHVKLNLPEDLGLTEPVTLSIYMDGCFKEHTTSVVGFDSFDQ